MKLWTKIFCLLALFSLGAGAQDGEEKKQPSTEAAKPPERIVANATLKAGGSVVGTLRIVDGKFVIGTEGGDRSIGMEAVEKLSVDIIDPRKKTEPVVGLPAPWRNKDVGKMVVPGKAAWRDGQFVVMGSPRLQDERFEAFHMIYLPLKGDCEVVARVAKLANEDKDSFAGIVLCDGLTPEHRKAMLRVHPHGGKEITFRRWGYQGGSSSSQKIPSLTLPYWLKLERKGFDVSAYYSPDGRRWRFLHTSPGRMRDEQIYFGLVARMQKHHRLSEAIIDHVSVNGRGDKPAKAMLPHVVLRSGSRVAARVVTADRTAFHLSGRWSKSPITSPRIARVEFYHPLPDDLQKHLTGERPGLLLRTGDFAEGEFSGLANEKLQVGSVLFGVKEYSLVDDADALVLRKVVERPASYRLETRAGSVLLAQKVALRGEQLVALVDGLGEVRFGVREITGLGPIAIKAP